MKTVGLRELKNRLSAYVRAVRDGETVVVTDRGEVVARLMPPKPSEKMAHPLAEMARRGEVTLGQPLSKEERLRLYRPLPRALRNSTVAELLDAERGDR